MNYLKHPFSTPTGVCGGVVGFIPALKDGAFSSILRKTVGSTVGTGWQVVDASAGHPDSDDEPPTWLAILEKE